MAQLPCKIDVIVSGGIMINAIFYKERKQKVNFRVVCLSSINIDAPWQSLAL
ncbi:MAG: hypothetical protein BWY75_00578 [bacterium ADurb.Bin425]|nr:MAG: hypothetical protein BWY75_00578 [bacterium ADurb.Bin425]